MAALLATARHRSVRAAAFRSSSFTTERSQASGTNAATPSSVAWRTTVSILSPFARPCTSITEGRRPSASSRHATRTSGTASGERHDLAFEVVLRRIDHRHVFPRRKPERAGVLRVVRGKAQRERLRPLGGDHLVLEIEVGQGHGSPNLVKVDWNLTVGAVGQRGAGGSPELP